jgi:hypothetical protein
MVYQGIRALDRQTREYGTADTGPWFALFCPQRWLRYGQTIFGVKTPKLKFFMRVTR